ncbi:MAG: hypothetical protein U0269_12590 [Polyangiales bacterium]
MSSAPHRSLALLIAALCAACSVRGALLTERDAGAPVSDGATRDTSAVEASADAAEAGASCGPAQDTSAVFAIASGQSHSCMIDRGALFCWGANNDGALGTGDSADRTRATAVSPSVRWLAVAAADSSTCAIDASRAVWCWGANGSGQLASNDTVPRASASLVQGLCDVRALSGTFEHYCAIDGQSRLWCWGRNDEGQLGQMDSYPGRNALAPVRVGPALRWRAVATGQGHTCGIAEPATLYCWGRNTGGQLGLGPMSPIQLRAPQRVEGFDDWSKLSLGQDSACAIRANGELFCWGEDGQSAMTATRVPTRIGALGDWTDVSVSTFSVCATHASEALSCWGRNDEGQLGLGDTAARAEPTTVAALSAATALGVGRFHSCVLDGARRAFCTGENNRGQLAVGDTARRSSFTPVLR